MPDAVDRYARYRRDPDDWMLGRFVLPARRLDEFAQAVRIHDVSAWQVSAIVGDEIDDDLARVQAFNEQHGGRIDTIELQAARPEDVIRQAAPVPPGMRAWFEVAPGAPLPETLAALKAVGHGAKLRMGGQKVDLIPPVETVAQFLMACARGGVRFKATAGLHHPVRSPRRLTYADDSARVLMHGFVNVFLAAYVAYEAVEIDAQESAAVATMTGLLDEQSAQAFTWQPDHVTWGRHRFEQEYIATVRNAFASSFGSCSFVEPLAGLRTLRWL
jgi:hypothetical protein